MMDHLPRNTMPALLLEIIDSMRERTGERIEVRVIPRPAMGFIEREEETRCDLIDAVVDVLSGRNRFVRLA